MAVIRVMSFNIWDNRDPDGGDEDPRASWAKRAPLAVQVLRRYRPDIIGFQELSEYHLDSLRGPLPEYAVGARLDHLEFGNIIFYRPDRFDLLDSGIFWLSRTPEQPLPDWDLPYSLSVQWVMLQVRESGWPLLFMNTQLEDGFDPNQVQMREQGSLIFLDQIERVSQRAPGAPVILAGDFNCNVWDKPYRNFVENRFIDTYRAAGHGDSMTSSSYHGYVGEAYSGLEWGDEQCWRVDWILARDGAQRLQTVSSTILHDAQPPVYPSDHWPVIADLRRIE